VTERSPEYEIFHAKIVELLVAATGEEWRYWWDQMNEYTQEFEDGETPEIVAQVNIEIWNEDSQTQ
jgi:hypothetical protein